MHPHLIDNDFAVAIECSTDSTPQVAILETAFASPPASVKALKQVIAVCANDQIAQSTFQQLKESPNFCTVRALQFSRKRPMSRTLGRRTLREKHFARDTHCPAASSNQPCIMAIFPAAAVRVPKQRVVSNEVAWRGSTSCTKDHCCRLRGWRWQHPCSMRSWEEASEPQATSFSCLSLSPDEIIVDVPSLPPHWDDQTDFQHTTNVGARKSPRSHLRIASRLGQVGFRRCGGTRAVAAKAIKSP